MKFTDILFLLAAAVTANAVLVSTDNDGLSETSGLSSSIYKRGRETPSDEDQSGNNDSNQGTALGGDDELIRQLEKEFEEANNAESIAANAFYKYRALRPHQERLILQGKPIYGERHSEQRQQELKKEWHAADKRMNLLRQKLQEARSRTSRQNEQHSIDEPGPSTSRQDEQHSIDEPGPSTSKQDEQYPDIDPSPCTTKPSRKLPSDREHPRETRELIQQLVQELEAADTAETVACDTSYGYRVVEHEQEKSISQGKPISGKKHSKQRQYRLDSQWQTAWRKVEFLEQKLQQARSSTSGRGRKHSIDKSGPSTSRRGGKRPSDEDQSSTSSRGGKRPMYESDSSTSKQDEQYPDIDPSPCTTKPSRKLPSDREYPRETRELIQQLVQELEAADTAETVTCDTSYGYRVVEHEQEKSISQGKPISGKKHSKQRQYRLDSQWQTAWRKVEFLEQKLQQARSSTSGRGRKYSIDESGPSISRRGGKRPSDEDQSSNADLNQKVMSRKANRHLRKLMKKVEKATRAKTAKCDAYRRSMSFEVEQDSEYILKTRKKLDKECKKEKGKVDRLKRRLERLSKKNDLEFGAESD
ncbi:hypothetical protein MT418_008012 [Batrachochytrium dendrobatidis]